MGGEELQKYAFFPYIRRESVILQEVSALSPGEFFERMRAGKNFEHD